MSQHANIMRKCLDIAFENKYQLKKLSDVELASLIKLQHSLWWKRILLSYLFNDYTDKSEELKKKCFPAINEALKRLMSGEGIGKMTVFSSSLLPILRQFDKYSKKIEKLFVKYIQELQTKETFSPQEEIAFASIFAHLSNLHINYDHPEYRFTIGEEKARQIVDKWLTTFCPKNGWENLSLSECLDIVICFQEDCFQNCYKCPWQKNEEIFWHYLKNISSYSERDFCQAVAARSINIDDVEKPYAEDDINKAFEILSTSNSLETRLMAAYSIVEIFHTLYLEEASAMYSIPEGTRHRYAEVLNVGNLTSMTDSELMRISKRALSVINTIEFLEEEYRYSIEELQIIKFARGICDELIVRGGSKMLKLVKDIGYYDTELPEIKRNWTLDGKESIQNIIDKSFSVENASQWSDTDLVDFAKLIKVLFDDKETLKVDDTKLEKSIIVCFAPLWARINIQEGDQLEQFKAIKLLFEHLPYELRYRLSDKLKDLGINLAESLIELKETQPEQGLSAIEIAASFPLCDTESDGFKCWYKNTIGMDYFRQEVSEWASELEKNGYWAGLNLEDAFRRIRVFQNDILHSIENIDYPWVITTAFNHYSKQIIEIDEESCSNTDDESNIILHPSSHEAVSLFADCYFNLPYYNLTDLMPVHFIRYCESGLMGELDGRYRWLIYSIILRSHFLQHKMQKRDGELDSYMN